MPVAIVTALGKSLLESAIGFTVQPGMLVFTPSGHTRVETIQSFSRNTLMIPHPRDGPVICHERLGGLLKFYERKAA